MNTDLYKVRSLRSSLGAAFQLFSTNFKTIFLRTWLPCAALAAACALFVFVSLPVDAATSLVAVEAAAWAKWLASVLVVMVLALAAAAWVNTHVVSLLNGLSVKRNRGRVVRLTALVAVLMLLLSVASLLLSWIPYVGMDANTDIPSRLQASGFITIGVWAVSFVLVVPLAYSMMRYLMAPDTRLGSVLGRGYLDGWRHWGRLFVTLFITSIIASLFSLVAFMPVLVLGFARQLDMAGRLLGDASGLPSYYSVLAYVVSLFSTFVFLYVAVWVEMVFYYVYGSIVERAKRKAALPQVA